jgi:hypothetical protein
MTPLRFITEEERNALNNESISKGGYRDHFDPGICFYMPWLHDPKDEIDFSYIQEKIKQLEQNPNGSPFLSIHYWKDWAHVRPPIQVVLPNRGIWVIDSKSTNGTGWSILIKDGILPSETNRNPKITASPSIDHNTDHKHRYHGWLTNGVLTEC